MEDSSSVAPVHASIRGDGEKRMMKMKEKVVSRDVELSPAQSSSVHRRPGLVLGANMPPAPEVARTNKAPNESFNDRMVKNGVYPCRYCSKQLLSFRALVFHHTAHERQQAYDKMRSYALYGPDPTISREAINQSCSSLLRARLEFMNQKKPFTPWRPWKPWTRSVGIRWSQYHGRLQPLQPELATNWPNQWVHRHGFAGSPGFQRTEALSLELTVGRSNDGQTIGPPHSRLLKRQEASSPNNVYVDHSGLDLTLRL